MSRISMGRAIGMLAAAVVVGRVGKTVIARVRARRAATASGLCTTGEFEIDRPSGESLSPDELADQASMESFPASDPPSWSPTTASNTASGSASDQAH